MTEQPADAAMAAAIARELAETDIAPDTAEQREEDFRTALWIIRICNGAGYLLHRDPALPATPANPPGA